MDITNIAAQTQQLNTNANNQLGNQNLGKDDFLKLLVTQMQNQDPINPMDGAQFASQLAEFNSVEQLINLNDGMEALANSQQSLNSGLSNTMAASLAGKQVRALSDKIGLEAGKGSEIQFELNDAATKAEITITDAADHVVRTEKLDSLGRGSHSWKWDGQSNAGNQAPDGEYKISINAENEAGSVDALTFIEGTAEKVHYSGNGVELLVGGVYIPLSDVQEIGVSSN